MINEFQSMRFAVAAKLLYSSSHNICRAPKALWREIAPSKTGIIGLVAVDFEDGVEQVAAVVFAGDLALSQDAAADHRVDVLPDGFTGGRDFKVECGINSHFFRHPVSINQSQSGILWQ